MKRTKRKKLLGFQKKYKWICKAARTQNYFFGGYWSERNFDKCGFSLIMQPRTCEANSLFVGRRAS